MGGKYISLREASKLCRYSQEYLSLRARSGRLKAAKQGRSWFTTREWLEEYVQAASFARPNLHSTAEFSKEAKSDTAKSIGKGKTLNFAPVSFAVFALFFVVAGYALAGGSIADTFKRSTGELSNISLGLRSLSAKEATAFILSPLTSTYNNINQKLTSFFANSYIKLVEAVIPGYSVDQQTSPLFLPPPTVVEKPVGETKIITREVQSITQIQPVKETVREVIKLDNTKLLTIQGDISILQTDLSQAQLNLATLTATVSSSNLSFTNSRLDSLESFIINQNRTVAVSSTNTTQIKYLLNNISAISLELNTNSDRVGLVVNQRGTNNIVQFQDSGTDILTIADGGATTLSSTLTVTGIATFSNATTSFNSVSYSFPSQDGSSGQALSTDGQGQLSWSQAGVNDATYVTLSTNSSLTDERVLTGTSNQITITDNGAGSTIVLSIPTSPIFQTPIATSTLSIRHTSQGDPILQLQDTDSGTNVWYLGFDNSDANKFRITPGGNFNATSSGITINAAGNVGIGTTNPSVALDITGAAQISTTLSVTGAATLSSTLAVTGIATFLNASTSFNGIEYGFPSADGNNGQVLSTNGSRVLSWITGGLFTDGGATTYLTSITDDLALGSSTANGPFLFDVSASLLTINHNSGDPTIDFQTASTTRWMIGVDDSDGDKFRIAQGGTFNATSSGLTINTAGFVGIGTTSPTTALDVSGTVTATTLSGSLASTNLTDGGTITFDWVDAEISDTLTIGNAGVVDADALGCDVGDDNLISENCIGDVLDETEIEDIYMFNTGDTGGSSVFNGSAVQALSLNRNVNDGDIVLLKRANTTEGTISVSGSTVSYNGFTGSHYAWTDEEIERGMLVTLTGENRNLHGNSDSEIIYGIQKSTVPNDPKILGAYLSLQNPSDPFGLENPHLIMAVGNADVWVVDMGEDLKVGDFLISSGVSGHAMKDPGTYGVAYIVARAAEPVDWSSVDETVDGFKHKKISIFFESFKFTEGTQISFNSSLSFLTASSTSAFSFQLDTTWGEELLTLTNSSSSTPILTIDSLGRLGIGTTSPTHYLTIAQGKGTAIADGWDVYSLEEYKTNIEYLEDEDTEDILSKIKNIPIARYNYKTDKDFTNDRHLGLIVETSPIEIISKTKQGISLYDLATFTLAGVKELANKHDELEERVTDLELKLDSAGSLTPTTTPQSGEATAGQADVGGLTPTSFLASLKDALTSLGATLQDGILEITQLVIGKLVIEIPQSGSATAGQATIGEGVILQGATSTTIHAPIIGVYDKVFVTFRTLPKQSWAVTGQTAGEGFAVGLEHPADEDLYFDWWIVGVEKLSSSAPPSPQPSLESEATEGQSEATEGGQGTDTQVTNDPSDTSATTTSTDSGTNTTTTVGVIYPEISPPPPLDELGTSEGQSASSTLNDANATSTESDANATTTEGVS